MKRGRNQRRRQGMNINRALDSNGPEVRIRGTANQIYDKYLALARDASSAGDRIKAENYLQHAEHYFRLIRAIQPPQPSQQEAVDGAGDQPSVENGEARENRRSSREACGNGADESAASDETKTEAASAEAGESSEDQERRRGRRRRPRRAAAGEEGAERAESERADADQANSEPEAAAS